MYLFSNGNPLLSWPTKKLLKPYSHSFSIGTNLTSVIATLSYSRPGIRSSPESRFTCRRICSAEGFLKEVSLTANNFSIATSSPVSSLISLIIPFSIVSPGSSWPPGRYHCRPSGMSCRIIRSPALFYQDTSEPHKIRRLFFHSLFPPFPNIRAVANRRLFPVAYNRGSNDLLVFQKLFRSVLFRSYNESAPAHPYPALSISSLSGRPLPDRPCSALPCSFLFPSYQYIDI